MKYAWVEANRDVFSIVRMYRLLAVSRTGYCQWRNRPLSERAQANAALDVRVKVIHTASRHSYGRLRIVRDLRDQGLPVGHERVRQSLQRQGLRPVYKRPYRVTTDSNHAHPIADNLLDRRFDGWQPNQAWVGDITYIATAEGWLYLAVILDLASRRVVGWSMSERMKADLVCDALHTDRGSQYASDKHRTLLRDYQMTQSMSRKGNCWDNAPMESFFKTLKVERIYQTQYATRAEARLDIVDWIEGFYNRQRLHSSIGYQTPVGAEASPVAA